MATCDEFHVAKAEAGTATQEPHLDFGFTLPRQANLPSCSKTSTPQEVSTEILVS